MKSTELAKLLLKDFDNHHPGSCFEESEICLSIQDAYRLQFEVARLRMERGESIYGYKIGCISQIMQQQLGITHPIFGHLWDSEIHQSGDTLDPKHFDNLAIEGEFAIRLAEDIPSADWARENTDFVHAGFVVIELHNYVFRGKPANRAAELIANNAIHAGVVMPIEETRVRSPAELHGANIRVHKNKRLLGETTLGETGETFLAGICLLAEHLEKFGRHLQKDQLILTGSPLPLWPVTNGDLIEVTSTRLENRSATKIGNGGTENGGS